jgi:IS4 transposase
MYIADRNFCTLGFLFGVAERRGFFVIGLHAQIPLVSSGTVRRGGRVDGREVLEQPATLRLGDRELAVRRVVVRLDTPTRDGDTELAILTQLPAGVADAVTVANLYRRRWAVASLFARVERNRQSEPSTLGYPGAAVFALAVALAASNVYAVVHDGMTKAHESQAEADAKPAPLSDF